MLPVYRGALTGVRGGITVAEGYVLAPAAFGAAGRIGVYASKP